MSKEEKQREQLQQMLQHIEDCMAEDLYDRAQEVLNTCLKLEVFDIRVYQRYAFVLRMLDRVPAAELFEKVAMNPDDPEAYYAVAQALLKDNLFGSAINPLRKTIELVPMAANATFELAYALLKEFRMEDALEHFKTAYEYSPSPNTAFYVAYTSLLSRDVEGAKALFPYMESEYAKHNQEPVMLNILRDMVTRYEAFPPKDLRDWHFVQYGTPLLRTSDEDLGEANENLNGRFVFINYGWLNVATILVTLKRLIEEVPGFPQYDYIIPASMDVAPIAFAFSEMTGIPLVPREELNTTNKGFLFTSWSDEVRVVAEHMSHNPNVTLFAFSLGWTLQAPVCPDIIGYLDQASRLPWQETMLIHENGERTPRPAMQVPPEVVQYHILERVEGVDQAEVDKLIAYYQERAHLLKVGENINNPRLGFQIESPIESIRMVV
ncbi:tetratricopeptide repeat protein [Tumebacillus flagellatus]|uniref:tetratricopeptide repeat protein n=1 Tax=Tumebacillus flagellatus TaxID=1157490 RepID=UPI000A7CA8A4|nr:CDC27 family protein [Tumebacillus flagellatus]